MDIIEQIEQRLKTLEEGLLRIEALLKKDAALPLAEMEMKDLFRRCGGNAQMVLKVWNENKKKEMALRRKKQ